MKARRFDTVGNLLATKPASGELFQRALAALQAGNSADAERHFKAVLKAQPRHVPALNLLGIILIQTGKFAEAESFLQRALIQNRASDVTLSNYGVVLQALDRPAEALGHFTAALAINALAAETWNGRGLVYADLGRHEDAVADFDRAIRLNSRYAEALCNKGKSLALLGRLQEALAAFGAALVLDNGIARAWLGRGNVFVELNDSVSALHAYDRAIVLEPGLAEAWLGRGNMHVSLQQLNEADIAYKHALSLQPSLAEAWLGSGNVLSGQSRYLEALPAYDKAVALQPDLAEAWLARGLALAALRRWTQAFADFDKAYHLNPRLKYAEGHRLFAKMHLCDWTEFPGEICHFIEAVREGRKVGSPFITVCVDSTPADQLHSARSFVSEFPKVARLPNVQAAPHDRIRLGYVSSDFHEHATAYLAAGLFDQHDKSRFETVAISYGPDQDSPMRRRLTRAFDRFVDVQAKDDREIADLIRQLEIDILVDLKGYTEGTRPGIFAPKPAPVQVNFLGYPGTMGADYFDYIIANSIVIPKEHFEFYSEKVVWLPDSYQVNDSQRTIADKTPARQALGLPKEGFVFCCFNNCYKITPEIFDIWMRLLRETPASVLWLLEDTGEASEQLRAEATRRGVTPGRLIFAPRMPLPEHLARQRQADLFLDTVPYNAHTTASDALWAGLPVLTCLGRTFAGRVAASLLKAADLDEFIATSLEDYEARAHSLVREPNLLASAKGTLSHNRGVTKLFDTAGFTGHLEAAYHEMWQAYQLGRGPVHFAV